MNNNSSVQGTVVYDGSCSVCQKFVNYLKKKDTNGKLEVSSYQLVDLNSVSPGLTEKMVDKAVYFVRRDGTRFMGAQGIYEVLKMMPGLLGMFGAIMALSPMSTLSKPFYRIFASNRHYVSKKLGLMRCITTANYEILKRH